MSHSITSDLLNPSLDTILLTDTFNEWVTRTNTIVDYLNPLNVYDVIPVTGSGITESRVSNYALSNGVDNYLCSIKQVSKVSLLIAVVF